MIASECEEFALSRVGRVHHLFLRGEIIDNDLDFEPIRYPRPFGRPVFPVKDDGLNVVLELRSIQFIEASGTLASLSDFDA